MIDNKRYVNRDVEAIREELYDFIKEQTDGWTDFNADTFESHVIDLVAGLSDMLCYYIDNSINETMLMRAKQEKNILSILETMNYNIETIGPARGTVTIERKETSLETIDDGKIEIPKWTRFGMSGSDILEFVATEKVVMYENETSKEVPIVQGVLERVEVSAEELKESYKYYVTEENVPLEWVFIDDTEWVKVRDAFLEINGGKKYSVHKDASNRVYIMFTYDWKKYLPSDGNEKISIAYLKTEATGGLVTALSVNTLKDAITDSNGNPVGSVVKIYNEEPTYGAFDNVDLNLHKANAKANFRTMDRIILLDDFEAKIREKSWILNCAVFDWRKDITIVSEPHKMKAWVVTVDGVDTNQAELTELRKELMKKTVSMTDLEIVGAEYVDIEIVMNICVKGNNDYREGVREQVEQALNEYFLPKNMSFGQLVDTDSVEDVATRVASTVAYPEVISFKEPYRLSPIQFPNITKIEVRLVGDIYGQKEDNQGYYTY